jgi:hypothetical protein
MPTRFLIAGERRCGTTSLYHWMQAHPELALDPQIDLNYFIEDELGGRDWVEGRADGEGWSRRHTREAYAARFQPPSGALAVGHKGADLFFWKPAHARIAAFLPEARLVVTLRDPVARAWSQYWNEIGKGRETLGFEDALDREDERVARSDYALLHLAYGRRGFYDESLAALHETFDAERVLVMITERMWKAPEAALREIYSFLGLAPERGLERAGKRFNPNWTTLPRPWTRLPVARQTAHVWFRLSEAVLVRTTKTAERRRRWRRILQAPIRRSVSGREMAPQTRRRLEALYRPHVERLETMLGAPIPEWTSKWGAA